MNEVEKMYRNCNIEPKQEGYCDWDSDCPYPDIINNGCGDECSYWKYEDEAKCPPFTAEKQLELIKVLAHCKGYTDYEHFGKYFNDYLKTLEFDEALANIVNDNWQDLTDAERTQIKEILSE